VDVLLVLHVHVARSTKTRWRRHTWLRMVGSLIDKDVKKLPLTLLSGFLGAGKTTLLKHILTNTKDLKVCIIVNDMSSLNIDAALIKNTKLVQTAERMVELQNGCICCTLREDLLQEVGELARSGKFDYLVIESTGISEPMQVAETFTMNLELDNDALQPLHELATLDTCVTVVDAANLLVNAESVESLMDRGDAAHEEDDRNVADLLLDQIEFSNVILLNKVDLISDDEARRLEALLKALNPSARVIRTNNSQVDLKEVISTGRFSFEEASRSAGWLQSLQEATPHTPETEEYGIGSFVFRSRKPFHPTRIHDFMNSFFCLQEPDWSDAIADTGRGKAVEDARTRILSARDQAELAAEALRALKALQVPENSVNPVLSDVEFAAEFLTEAMGGLEAVDDVVDRGVESKTSTKGCSTTLNADGFKSLKQKYGNILRSKGFVWLGSRPDLCGEWSQAGAVLRFTVGGPWYASLPDEAWPSEDEARREILKDFEGPHGDRRQELVFIGIDMDRGKIEEALESCLMADDEVVSEDPFAVWPALEDLIDAGHDEDDSAAPGNHEDHSDCGHDHANEGVDSGAEGGPLSYMPPGRMIKITDGGSEAQHVLDSVRPGTTVIFHWDAEWHAEGAGIAKQLESMVNDIDALVVHVDIGSHPPNWSFAMEKVMTKPESNRQGAKPILKDGRKWPCFTVHHAPELQPVETVAGSHAINSIRKLIDSLPEWTGPHDTMHASYVKRHVSKRELGTGLADHADQSVVSFGDVIGHFPRISNGAVDLREHLKAFSQGKKNLCILWEEDGVPLKVLKGLQAIVSKRPEADNLFLADVSIAPNAALGKALGVRKSPSLLIFSNMKLSKKFDGPDKVTEALAQEFRTLPPRLQD
jgi:G3E family GTPase